MPHMPGQRKDPSYPMTVLCIASLWVWLTGLAAYDTVSPEFAGLSSKMGSFEALRGSRLRVALAMDRPRPMVA